MPYLALQEAAAEIHRRTTVDVTAEQLLRLGIAGELLIVSWFSSTMRNVTAQKNEDVLGLLVIPPMHLGDIEFGGETSIQGAFSLDGKSAYAPYIKRTRQQLRIRRPDLESFIAQIEKAQNEQATTAAVVPETNKSVPPEQADTQPASKSAAVETVIEREDRRYREFVAMGGDYIKGPVRWYATGPRGLLAVLIRKVEAAGEPMRNERNVREGLKNAATRAKNARAAGYPGSSVFPRQVP